MEAITELNNFKKIIKDAACNVRDGKLDVNRACAMSRLGNTYQKLDNGVVQRLKIKERTNRP